MAINAISFEHTSANGTKFTGTRCDFADGIQVEAPENLTELAVMQDVAEFIGWHRGSIWEQLNGFRGYDQLPFKFNFF